MSELDAVRLSVLSSMERTGLLSSDEVFDKLVSPRGWSEPASAVVSHGKKRRH